MCFQHIASRALLNDNAHMAVLLITPTAQTEAQRKTLEGDLLKRFGNACLKLPRDQWFVAYEGTSRQLSEELDIATGRCGSLIVVLVGGYWGYSGKDVWEWLAINTK